jgi:hypothetical protein
MVVNLILRIMVELHDILLSLVDVAVKIAEALLR